MSILEVASVSVSDRCHARIRVETDAHVALGQSVEVVAFGRRITGIVGPYSVSRDKDGIWVDLQIDEWNAK